LFNWGKDKKIGGVLAQSGGNMLGMQLLMRLFDKKLESVYIKRI
jgi:hypothetical protein